MRWRSRFSRPAAGLLAAGFLAACGVLPQNQGPPPAPGARLCIGVPGPVCQAVLEGRINERVGVELIGYRVSCKVASCTAESGEAEAALRWADGMTEVFSYQWAGGG